VLLTAKQDGCTRLHFVKINLHLLKFGCKAMGVLGDAGESAEVLRNGDTVVPSEAGELFVAFGSGSSPRRERILVVSNFNEGTPKGKLYDASVLYGMLRGERDFAGSDMNIEGAVYVDGFIRLFGRGNGSAGNGYLPLNATCDLEWKALWAYLHCSQLTPPSSSRVMQYDLGSIDEVQLGFTDATVASDEANTLLFSAAAEASPDATRDGIVRGSVLGVIDERGEARWTKLNDIHGNRLCAKVEGLQIIPEVPNRAWIVFDEDNPGEPSLLCEVELAGTWF
jgi:hypothetical protein